MSGKHTPGPWHIEGGTKIWAGDELVAGAAVMRMPHAANAALIAAAPDLARALADLLADALSMGLDDSPVSGSLIEARKALRKAGVL